MIHPSGGQPATPVRPIGHPGVDHPQGVFDVFSYYRISNVISKHDLPDHGTCHILKVMNFVSLVRGTVG
jgi:hypothetical protein